MSGQRPPPPPLFAPQGGWRVRILDLSGGAEDGITEEIGGFASLMQANEFAARYVRDQVEHCRAPGMDARAVMDAWLAFGEDAKVIDAPDGYDSAPNLATYAATPAPAEARNWRAFDPRLIDDGQDGQDDPASDADEPPG